MGINDSTIDIKIKATEDLDGLDNTTEGLKAAGKAIKELANAKDPFSELSKGLKNIDAKEKLQGLLKEMQAIEKEGKIFGQSFSYINTAKIETLKTNMREMIRVGQENTAEFKKMADEYNKLKGFNFDNILSSFKKITTTAAVVVGAVIGIDLALTKLTETSRKYDMAMLGLQATSKAFGQDSNQAMKYAQELASDGLMSVAEAAQTLKNLMGTNFSIDQAFEMSKAMKNIGAFNRTTEELGQGMVDASKGIKTNSIELIENIGLTTKLSTAMKQAGVSQADGINLSTDAAQRMAVFNAILAENAKFYGNAAQYAESFAGSQSKANAEMQQFLTNIGHGVQPVAQAWNNMKIGIVGAFNDIIDSKKKSDEIMRNDTAARVQLQTFEDLKKKVNLTDVETKIYHETIEQLKAAYPEYLNAVDLEKDSYEELAGALEKVNKQLDNKKLYAKKANEVSTIEDQIAESKIREYNDTKLMFEQKEKLSREQDPTQKLEIQAYIQQIEEDIKLYQNQRKKLESKLKDIDKKYSDIENIGKTGVENQVSSANYIYGNGGAYNVPENVFDSKAENKFNDLKNDLRNIEKEGQIFGKNVEDIEKEKISVLEKYMKELIGSGKDDSEYFKKADALYKQYKHVKMPEFTDSSANYQYGKNTVNISKYIDPSYEETINKFNSLDDVESKIEVIKNAMNELEIAGKDGSVEYSLLAQTLSGLELPQTFLTDFRSFSIDGNEVLADVSRQLDETKEKFSDLPSGLDSYDYIQSKIDIIKKAMKGLDESTEEGAKQLILLRNLLISLDSSEAHVSVDIKGDNPGKGTTSGVDYGSYYGGLGAVPRTPTASDLFYEKYGDVENDLKKIEEKYKDAIGYQTDIEKKVTAEKEAHLVEIGRMRNEETTAYKTFVSELEGFASSVSQLANNLEALTGNSAFGLAGDLVGSGMSIWKGTEAYSKAGAEAGTTGLETLGTLGGATAALGIAGAVVGAVGAIGSYFSEENAKADAEAAAEWQKLSEETAAQTEKLDAISSNTKDMAENILEAVSKNPTTANIQNGKNVIDDITKAVIGKRDNFSDVEWQTKHTEKYLWGAIETADYDNHKIETSEYENGNTLEEKIANAEALIKRIDATNLESLEYTRWSDDGERGSSNEVTNDNLDAVKKQAQDYIELLEKLQKSNRDFARDATLESFVGVSVTAKADAVAAYQKQLETILDPEKDKELISSMTQEYSDSISGSGVVMVTAMQDVRAATIKAFEDGATAGEAFAEGTKVIFDDLKTNIASIFYDINFSEADKQLEEWYGGLATTIADWKANGQKIIETTWSKKEMILDNGSKFEIAIPETTITDISLEDLIKKETEGAGFWDELLDAKNATASMDTTIEALRNIAIEKGFTPEEAAEMFGLTSLETKAKETFEDMKPMMSSIFGTEDEWMNSVMDDTSGKMKEKALDKIGNTKLSDMWGNDPSIAATGLMGMGLGDSATIAEYLDKLQEKYITGEITLEDYKQLVNDVYNSNTVSEYADKVREMTEAEEAATAELEKMSAAATAMGSALSDALDSGDSYDFYQSMGQAIYDNAKAGLIKAFQESEAYKKMFAEWFDTQDIEFTGDITKDFKTVTDALDNLDSQLRAAGMDRTATDATDNGDGSLKFSSDSSSDGYSDIGYVGDSTVGEKATINNYYNFNVSGGNFYGPDKTELFSEFRDFIASQEKYEG